ncbi:MAG TPA: hypothetical protein VNX29_03220 [Kaistia sp.]|nr:hypothetical protein [Kaistia sp.]
MVSQSSMFWLPPGPQEFGGLSIAWIAAALLPVLEHPETAARPATIASERKKRRIGTSGFLIDEQISGATSGAKISWPRAED